MSRKNEQLEAAIIRITVTIVTLVFVLLGVVKAEQICYKIAKTGASLMVLNDNAQFYNEQARKTDAMTDTFEAERKERNEKFYQSEDLLIRVYSNLPALVKLAIWFLSLLLMLLIPFFALFIAIREIETEKYFWKRDQRIKERREKRERRQEQPKDKGTVFGIKKVRKMDMKIAIGLLAGYAKILC